MRENRKQGEGMKITIDAEPKEVANLLLAIEERPVEKTFSVLLEGNNIIKSQEDIHNYIQRFGQKIHSASPDLF